MFAAFLVMFANFATFCFLYDRPHDRARLRVAAHQRRMNPYTAVAPRLATGPIATIPSDRHMEFGPLTLLNLATGIAAIGLLIWGVVLRIF